MRARTDLGLVVALAVAACVFAALIPTSIAVLRAPVALPLVLALPGYAIVTAIFSPHELRTSERVLLSMAASIVTTIFSALVLEAFAIKLTTIPWMGLLAVVTIVAAARGTARGHARPLRAPRVRPARVELLALAGALVLLAGALALALTPLGAPKGLQGTTGLWIVPDGTAAVELSVVSDQAQAGAYTVQLSVAGKAQPQIGPITLRPGASWTRVVAVPAGQPLVQAVLRTTSDPTAAYRTVALRCWCTTATPALLP